MKRADLVIRGGTIVDGSGNAAYTSDVVIEGDRIASIGRYAGGHGARAGGKDSGDHSALWFVAQKIKINLGAFKDPRRTIRLGSAGGFRST